MLEKIKKYLNNKLKKNFVVGASKKEVFRGLLCDMLCDLREVLKILFRWLAKKWKKSVGVLLFRGHPPTTIRIPAWFIAYLFIFVCFIMAGSFVLFVIYFLGIISFT